MGARSPAALRMTGRDQGGFTLIELAVVLIILGTLAGAGSYFALGFLQQQRTTAVRGSLDAVEEALALYVARHRRLPCPADALAGDGRANGDPDDGCADDQEAGILPWVDLGLAERQVVDPWGRFYSYRVGAELVLTNAMNMSGCDPVVQVAVMCTEANLDENCTCDYLANRPEPIDSGSPFHVEAFLDGKGLGIRSSATAGDNDLLDPADGNGAAYVVISHGPNGYGGYSQSGAYIAQSTGRSPPTPANEAPNRNDNGLRAFYVDATQRFGEDDPLYFDDVLRRPTVLSVANRAGLGPRPGG